MAGFFDECRNPLVNLVKESSFASNQTARKGTRISMGAEVLGQTTSYFTPIVSIPTAGAQFLISSYLALMTNANAAEKLAHSGLSVGALFKLVILSLLLFEHKTCTKDSTDTLCDLGLYAQLLYACLLIVLSIISESSKAKTATGTLEGSVLPVVIPVDEDNGDAEPTHSLSPSLNG